MVISRMENIPKEQYKIELILVVEMISVEIKLKNILFNMVIYRKEIPKNK